MSFRADFRKAPRMGWIFRLTGLRLTPSKPPFPEMQHTILFVLSTPGIMRHEYAPLCPDPFFFHAKVVVKPVFLVDLVSQIPFAPSNLYTISASAITLLRDVRDLGDSFEEQGTWVYSSMCLKTETRVRDRPKRVLTSSLNSTQLLSPTWSRLNLLDST